MASEIETMQNSLNVKKNNLNNKRLSRLQGVILKILSAAYPSGYDKRMLARLTAQGYGKGSMVSSDDILKKQLDDATDKPQDDSNMLLGIEKLRSAYKKLAAIPLGHARDDCLAPKFSVSYSRSIRSLLNKGFVAYLPATRTDGKESGWAVFITEKGLAMATKKKVEINAKFWDAFLASLKKEEDRK